MATSEAVVKCGLPAFGLGTFTHPLKTITHREPYSLIVRLVGQFLNIHASSGSSPGKLGGLDSYLPELVKVKLNLTLGQLAWLVAKKSDASETEELTIVALAAQVC